MWVNPRYLIVSRVPPKGDGLEEPPLSLPFLAQHGIEKRGRVPMQEFQWW